GVAAFEAHHRETAARAIHQHCADLFLRVGVQRFLLADVKALRARREIEEGFGGEMVVEDHVGGLENASAFDGEEIRIARPRPDEVDPAQAHPAYTVSRICRAPISSSCAPSARPISSAFTAGPSDSARMSDEPSGDATTPRRWRTPSRTVAWAPMGTWHPPP